MSEAKLGIKGDEMMEAVNSAQGSFDFRNIMKLMGDRRFDVDAYLASPDAEDHTAGMACMLRGEDTAEALAYWRSFGKGLIKEMHDPEDPLKRWASYVPVSSEKDPDRRYPLIFVLHGAHNPILMTEGYGMIQVAAEKECVVIVPQDENEDMLLALLAYAKEHYPVDPSRVYVCGYSFGGFMTSRHLWRHPELFAGVGWGGMLFATEIGGHEMDGQYYPAYKVTEEMVRHVAETEIPVLLFMGENEMLCLEPLWRDQEGKEDGHVIPLDSRDKQAAFNNLRAAAGCAPEAFKARDYYEKHEDPVVRSIGAEFERTQIIEDRGRKYFIGDSVNGNGEALFRTVSAEGMNHSTTRMWAPMIWDHISRYARDTETGKLIRL